MRHTLLLLLAIPTAVGYSTRAECSRMEFPEPPRPLVAVDPQAAKCLATMVYGEARGETREGKIAVAWSAVNRAKKKTICEVVLAPMQYSIFNGNSSLRQAALSENIEPRQKNPIDRDSWLESMAVARSVLSGESPDPTNGSTHYLAPVAMQRLGLSWPRWSQQYKIVASIDNHVFYKPYYPKKKK